MSEPASKHDIVVARLMRQLYGFAQGLSLDIAIPPERVRPHPDVLEQADIGSDRPEQNVAE